jgi:hypothetical protein
VGLAVAGVAALLFLAVCAVVPVIQLAVGKHDKAKTLCLRDTQSVMASG